MKQKAFISHGVGYEKRIWNRGHQPPVNAVTRLLISGIQIHAAQQMRIEKSQEISRFSSRNEDAALCWSQIPVLPVATATYLGRLQCSIGWGWSHLAHGLLPHYALALLEGNRETLFSTSPKGSAALFSAAPTRQIASPLNLQGCCTACRC